MTYLLIALVLAIILSPLLGLRSSPRQKLITAMRRCAVSHGLQVKLSRPADAREGEGRLDSVIYRLPWPRDSAPSGLRHAEAWLLVRHSGRGAPAPWDDWRWLSREAASELMDYICVAVEQLHADITGIEASHEGLSVYWREHGMVSDVEQLSAVLKRLQEQIRPLKNQ